MTTAVTAEQLNVQILPATLEEIVGPQNILTHLGAFFIFLSLDSSNAPDKLLYRSTAEN